MTAADAEPPRRPAASRSHRVHRFLGRLHEVLDDIDTDTVWALSPPELAECLLEAYAAQARLAAWTLGLVAQADRTDLPAHDGIAGLVAWLRERALLAPAEGKRQVRLAKALQDQPVVQAALTAGGFPAASAAVIAETLHALPDDLDPAVRAQAETYLAGEAHTHDTHTLRRLAAHLDEVLDPDGADARLAAQLARAEANAARTTFFHLHHDEHTATTEGTFRIPLLAGVRLQRMLDSLTNPARPNPIPTQIPTQIPTEDPAEDPVTGIRLSAEERRGHALVELIDRIPAKKLPQLGGSAPTVVVTMALSTLMGGLNVDHLDTGPAIS